MIRGTIFETYTGFDFGFGAVGSLCEVFVRDIDPEATSLMMRHLILTLRVICNRHRKIAETRKIQKEHKNDSRRRVGPKSENNGEKATKKFGKRT